MNEAEVKQTMDAMIEMKFLYEHGVDLENLAATYPMSKEKIKECCGSPLWDNIDWMSIV